MQSAAVTAGQQWVAGIFMSAGGAGGLSNCSPWAVLHTDFTGTLEQRWSSFHQTGPAATSQWTSQDLTLPFLCPAVQQLRFLLQMTPSLRRTVSTLSVLLHMHIFCTAHVVNIIVFCSFLTFWFLLFYHFITVIVLFFFLLLLPTSDFSSMFCGATERLWPSNFPCGSIKFV